MKRALLLAISVAAAAGAFGLVLHFSRSSIGEVARGVERAGWAALSTLLLVVLLQNAVQAWSWRWLFPGEALISYPAAMGSILVGNAFNFLTPSAYLGGEAFRMLYASRHSPLEKRQILATIIVHKFLELTTFLAFLVASTAILFATYGPRLDPAIRWAVLATVGLLVALGAFLYLSFVRRWGLVVRLCDVASRFGLASRWIASHRRKILELESHVHRAFTRRTRRTLASLGSMTIFTAILFVRPVAVFGYMEGNWPFHVAELATVFCLVQLLQALQFTPGGFGLLEGGVPAILLVVGVPAPAGLAFIAFTRVTDLVMVGAGCGLLVHHGLAGPASESRRT